MAKIAFIYVPVLHEGYRLFLTENLLLENLYLLDQNWLKSTFTELEYLHKDLRALPVASVKKAVESWQLVEQVSTVQMDTDWPKYDDKDQIILTNDDIGRALAKKYFSNQSVNFSPIFLRWDRSSTLHEKNIETDAEINTDDLAKKYMTQAFASASQSSDWWRHVGAVLVNQNGEVLLATANRHQPTDQTPYEVGDTRSLFKQGEFVEMSTASHAESSLIAAAAKNGLKLAGCSLYVTDFPCPYCARVIAESGVKNLFFSRGYAVMDGLEILKNSDILIQRVILSPENEQAAVANSHSKTYSQ